MARRKTDSTNLLEDIWAQPESQDWLFEDRDTKSPSWRSEAWAELESGANGLGDDYGDDDHLDNG